MGSHSNEIRVFLCVGCDCTTNRKGKMMNLIVSSGSFTFLFDRHASVYKQICRFFVSFENLFFKYSAYFLLRTQEMGRNFVTGCLSFFMPQKKSNTTNNHRNGSTDISY